MWSITIHSRDDAGLLTAELWDLGTTGIEDLATGIRAYFEDSIDPELIHDRFKHLNAFVQPNVPLVPDQHPAAHDPVYAGKRFVVVPVPWADAQRQLTPHLIVLPIDAALAFGSGRHETTQLCLQALEQLVKPGDTVFDVGCGSAILALAAQKLGADVIAADIDELAIDVARRHFSGPLFVGSADGFPSHAADLVVCNITPHVNDRLAFDLRRILKPDGKLILSGFTTENAPKSFQPDSVLTLEGWQCWVCQACSVLVESDTTPSNDHDRQWWIEPRL